MWWAWFLDAQCQGPALPTLNNAVWREGFSGTTPSLNHSQEPTVGFRDKGEHPLPQRTQCLLLGFFKCHNLTTEH